MAPPSGVGSGSGSRNGSRGRDDGSGSDNMGMSRSRNGSGGGSRSGGSGRGRGGGDSGHGGRKTVGAGAHGTRLIRSPVVACLPLILYKLIALRPKSERIRTHRFHVDELLESNNMLVSKSSLSQRSTYRKGWESEEKS